MKTVARLIFVFSIMAAMLIWCLTAAADQREGSEEFLAQVDEFLDSIENPTVPEPIVYTWNQEIIGKVVGFEVGNCCDQCKYLVASACINRFYNWYDKDVVAMVSDNNGEFYQMNPDYIYSDEMNGFNFWEHYDSIMQIVDKATEHPAKCYYWDNSDSQREWSELMYHCEKDGCWFYR